VVHGFVRAGGTWYQYDSPNVPSGFLAQTEIRGINDAGDLLGDIPGKAFVSRGYSLSGGFVVGGAEELVDLPGTSTQGFRAIDSAGRLVGFENLALDVSQAWLLTPESGGPGLAGSGGLVPLHYTKGGTAKVGNAGFRYAADALVGGSVGFLYIGLSALALPLFGGTAWVGPPQVLFLSQPTAGTPGVAGSGRLDIATPIPPDPALAGLVLHSQVFVLDFAAVQQIAMSQGASLTLKP